MATKKTASTPTSSDTTAVQEARSASEQLRTSRIIASDASQAEMLAGVTAIAAEALQHTNEASLVAAELAELSNRLSAESMLYAAEAVPIRLLAEQLSAEVSVVAAEQVDVTNALISMQKGEKDNVNLEELIRSAEASLSSAMVVFNSAEIADVANSNRIDA